MTPQRAFLVASQWGSYSHSGDQGACFYAFRFNDGRPTDEGHRRACLSRTDRCLEIAKANPCRRDRTDLLELRRFFETCDLAPCPH